MKPIINMFRIICLFVLLSIPVSIFGQTTIIFRRTSTDIILGADSRQTGVWVDPLGERHETVTSNSMCKIIVAKKRAFSFAGYTGTTEVGRVDIEDIGRKALIDGTGVENAANLFTTRVFQEVEASLENLRRTDIVSYRDVTISKTTKRIKPPLSVFFVGVENGIAKVAVRTFKVLNPETEVVQLALDWVNCPGRECPNKNTITAFNGHYNQIKKYRDDETFWKQNGSVGGIRQLIEIMIKSDPKVGGPIDILHLGKDGVCWVEPKTRKDCDEPEIEVCKSPPMDSRR